MKNVFEAEGDLREVDPLAALVTSWREKTSGSLRFTRGASECGFDLDEGEVIAVVSSDPRFETAAILVRAGKLAADAVERLAPQGGDPALAALQTGLLTRREWKWGEKIRSIEVLSDLLSWNDGRYRFDAAAHSRGGDFRLPVPRLLLELFLRSRDRNLIDHQLGAPEQALVRGERFDAEFSGFGLTADAESVVRLIDGRSTAAQIAERAPAEEFAVRKLLAALVTLGLVHPVPVAPVRSPDRAPSPDQPLSPVLPVAESSAERGPEDFNVSPDIPSRGEDSFEAELSVADDQPQPEPEQEMVELPAATGSALDRFEPASPMTPWEPEPPVRPAQRDDLWGSSSGDSGPSEPEAAAGRRSGAALAWAFGILLAAVVAVVLWRGRGSGPRQTAGARPTSIPAVTFPPPVTAVRMDATQVRPAAATTVAPAAVTPLPTARRAVEPTAAPTPHAQSAATRPAAKASPVPAREASEPPAESREAWIRRAERDRRRLEADRRSRFAIQLELVCEIPSLQEAWRHDQGQLMWLLRAPHAERDCFRVFWGRYPTLEAAKKAKTGVPSYFVTARNHPAVVSVR